MTSGVYDEDGPWAPGTIVVVRGVSPAGTFGIFVADPTSDHRWWPGMRFLRVEKHTVVNAWMAAEGVARATYGGIFAMVPDTPEKAMAVRLRWA